MPSQEFEKLKSLLAEDVSDIEAYVKTLQNAGVVFTADYKTEMTSDNKLLLAVHIHAPEELTFSSGEKIGISQLDFNTLSEKLSKPVEKALKEAGDTLIKELLFYGMEKNQ
jgi:hypothetical protein